MKKILVLLTFLLPALFFAQTDKCIDSYNKAVDLYKSAMVSFNNGVDLNNEASIYSRKIGMPPEGIGEDDVAKISASDKDKLWSSYTNALTNFYEAKRNVESFYTYWNKIVKTCPYDTAKELEEACRQIQALEKRIDGIVPHVEQLNELFFKQKE